MYVNQAHNIYIKTIPVIDNDDDEE